MDQRYQKLASGLIRYSCALQPGENVLIEAIDIPHTFTKALVAEAHAVGARPLVHLKSVEINRALMQAATTEQWDIIADYERLCMEKMHAYIGIRGNPNIAELSDVPADKQRIYEQSVWKRVHHEVRVKKTRWVVLRWPTNSFAQLAQMSTEAFEEFFFNVCNMDYARMSRAMQPLKAYMERTDKVRLLGPGDTDLTFSIKGIPAIPCDGHMNIPDGEVYTAPVRESIEGVIAYNTPTIYRGTVFNDVRLTFKQGKIVAATANHPQRLNEILDADAGARYVGEFAIGVNPYCTRPMLDILFDEKISGSIHLTPGACYDEASNGNKSDIHWDMVLRQTPDVGGGKIYFDDRLVRQDGIFVVPELAGLNPDHLMG
ncbi:MAG: aminopeptidase [Phycisphaerae bacterium]